MKDVAFPCYYSLGPLDGLSSSQAFVELTSELTAMQTIWTADCGLEQHLLQHSTQSNFARLPFDPGHRKTRQDGTKSIDERERAV